MAAGSPGAPIGADRHPRVSPLDRRRGPRCARPRLGGRIDATPGCVVGVGDPHVQNSGNVFFAGSAAMSRMVW